MTKTFSNNFAARLHRSKPPSCCECGRAIGFADAVRAQRGRDLVRMRHRPHAIDRRILQLRDQAQQGVEIVGQPDFFLGRQIEPGEVGETMQLGGFDGHGCVRDKTAILLGNRLVRQARAR